MKKMNMIRKETKKAAAVAALLALTVSSAMTTWAGQTGTRTAYSASADNAHAIEASGQDVSYQGISVTKTGSGSGESADFEGTNAAVFATDGATLTISDADISTSGTYANAVFSYGEGTTINISDATITTTQRNSGGIMVTGGGSLNAENLTIQTEGGSSAAIRSDRGGGTINVNGGSYTSNGSGSPAIYSTADITVSGAKLKSGTAQAVVVEGGNTVTLNDCDVTGNNTVHNSDKSNYYQAVMLYQSMSGDAAGGEGSFTMTGGSLTSLNGGIFFVTNAAYEINLNDVDITCASNELLRACAAGWGNSGSNGGQVTLNAANQELKGNIIVDSVSALNMYLKDASSFTGTFKNEGEVYVELEEGSVWNLTADCSISALTCGENSINLNGHTLTVGGEAYTEGSASTGTAAEISQDEGKDGNKSQQNMPEQENPSGQPGGEPNTQPGQPDGEPNTQPGQPDGESNTQSGQPGGEPNTQPGQPDGEFNAQPGQSGDENSNSSAKPDSKPEMKPDRKPDAKPDVKSGASSGKSNNGKNNPPTKPNGTKAL